MIEDVKYTIGTAQSASREAAVEGESGMHSTNWNSEKSAELYRSNRWGETFIEVDEDGYVLVCCEPGGRAEKVKLVDVVKHVEAQGGSLPALIRFPSILAQRVKLIQKGFADAIAAKGYRGKHRLCFPVKTNHRRRVISNLRKCGVGLEVGTKAELLIGVSEVLQGLDLPLLCNGYKDRSYLEYALRLFQSGIKLTITLENPSEVTALIRLSEEMGVKPDIGLRLRLSTFGKTRWAESSGEEGMFGLSTPQLMWAIDRLKEAELDQKVSLLHYHLGSQITDYKSVENAASEAAKVYSDLKIEGIPISAIDIGGGLAVEYEGTDSESFNSKNYSISKYAVAVVDSIFTECQRSRVEHPDIYTESGRAVAAHHSIFLFEVFGSPPTFSHPFLPPEQYGEELSKLSRAVSSNPPDLEQAKLIYQSLCNKYASGELNLRQRAEADRIVLNVKKAMNVRSNRMYYGNFSIFQSLPDVWGVNQVFPVMPIHRLNEMPSEDARISDITCDSDGQFRNFQSAEGDTLPLHPIEPGKRYILGVFNVGAYQETIGDIHNLLARTSIMSVLIGPGGKPEFRLDNEPDNVASVLEPVGYVAGEVLEEIFNHFETATDCGLLSEEECDRAYSQTYEIMDASTYLNLHEEEAEL